MDVLNILVQYGIINSAEDYLRVLGILTSKTRKWVRDTKLARKLYKNVYLEHDGHILVDSEEKPEDCMVICSPMNEKEAWKFTLKEGEYRDSPVYSSPYCRDDVVYGVNKQGHFTILSDHFDLPKMTREPEQKGFADYWVDDVLNIPKVGGDDDE
jgi:hypothetical protein